MTTSELGPDPVEFLVAAEDEGTRLDQFLAREFPKHSRMQIRRVISAGGVTINGGGAKVAHKLRVGQKIVITLPPMPTAGPNPEELPLEILHEDEHLIVVNKPPRMVVHPSRGHWSGTLASALAFHFGKLSTAGGENRPGIVHRLDRDTSGVMVVAKTDPMHFALSDQFAERTTEKEYFAITTGVPDHDRDIVDQPIGLHPYQREKMAIRPNHESARQASTYYEVVERFHGFAALKLQPKTGRTHQIRVHLAHIHTPVLCDRLYGGRASITRGDLLKSSDDEILLDRQALHAHRIRIKHPHSGVEMEFVAPIPADLLHMLDELRTHRPVVRTHR